MSQRDLRAIPRVNYAALAAGRSSAPTDVHSPSSIAKDQRQFLPAPSSPSTVVTIDAQLPDPQPLPTDVESLRSAVTAAKAEHEQLLRQSELRGLQRDLALLQQQNAQLKGRHEDPPPSSKPLNMQDIRAIPGITSRAEEKLKQLGLSDSSSGSGDSDDGDETHNHRRSERAKRGKKLRSGKTAKLTSKVLHPQIWPHSELSLSYVSKDVTYDTITLAEFAAGYASILRLPRLSDTERNARIEHFATLMYLATQFPWPSVRSLHAAALFEIECGRLRWGDSFAHLEARLLHGTGNPSRSSNAATQRQMVQFCRAYQSGKCSSTKDHYGLIKNERKWVQHICAKCWLSKQEVHRHRENSSECPSTTGVSTSSPHVGPSNA